MFSKVEMHQKQPPAFIMAEFKKYGIQPSGDKDSDMKALISAKAAKGESTQNIEAFKKVLKEEKTEEKQIPNESNESAKTKPAGSPPWANLMSSLGLELQGSKEEDFSAMSSKLTQMSSLASTPEQKANLESLNSQYEYYYNQLLM